LRIKKLWKDLHFRSMMLLSHQLIIASHWPNFQTCIFFLFLWYKVSLTFWLYFFSFSSQVKNSWNVYSNLIVLKSLIDISFINWRSMKRMGLIGLKLILKITKSAWISLRRYFNWCLFLCPSFAPIDFSLV
jgi:hypothetical protein